MQLASRCSDLLHLDSVLYMPGRRRRRGGDTPGTIVPGASQVGIITEDGTLFFATEDNQNIIRTEDQTAPSTGTSRVTEEGDTRITEEGDTRDTD